MPVDPYDEIDAPSYADLAAGAGSDLMSPNTANWFPLNARETVAQPAAYTEPSPPAEVTPPPPPPPAAPAHTAPKAVRVPSVASKPTKSSKAWAERAPATTPAVTTQPAAKAAPKTVPAQLTKPSAPVLGVSSRAKPVASTEELQMQAAAREIRANKQQRDKWRQHLDKVLQEAGTKALPARSTKELTMPVEFDLTNNGQLSRPGSASVPSSPMSTPRSATKGLMHTHKPVAEQVHEFTKTPKRFRGKPANGPITPSSIKSDRSAGPTSGKAPDFRSDARAAARGGGMIKSTEEMEAEEMANYPAFKANPVNPAVMESSGQLGVPRVAPKAITKPREFMLTTASRVKVKEDDASSDAGSTASAPARYQFKARPINKAVMEGRAAGLAQVTPRKLTKPVSPNLSTSSRAASKPTPQPAEEESNLFSSFKARPMPDMSAGPSPLKSPREQRSLTSPKPFNLTSTARHEMAKEAHRAKVIEEAAAAIEKSRQFKARPMPLTEGWKPNLSGKHTEAKSFELSTSSRSEVHQDAFKQKAAMMELEMKRQANFKAKPAQVLSAPAFEPRKSTKPLTSITDNVPFANSLNRQARRKELEGEMAVKRAQVEAMAQEKAKHDAIAAAKEIAEMRAKMTHKARPVMKAAPFVLKKAPQASLTVPEEFSLTTNDRAGVRATAIA